MPTGLERHVYIYLKSAQKIGREKVPEDELVDFFMEDPRPALQSLAGQGWVWSPTYGTWAVL